MISGLQFGLSMAWNVNNMIIKFNKDNNITNQCVHHWIFNLLKKSVVVKYQSLVKCFVLTMHQKIVVNKYVM